MYEVDDVLLICAAPRPALQFSLLQELSWCSSLSHWNGLLEMVVFNPACPVYLTLL